MSIRGVCKPVRDALGGLLEVRPDPAGVGRRDYLLLWLKSEGDLKMSRQDIAMR
jgi:hypothetical protein